MQFDAIDNKKKSYNKAVVPERGGRIQAMAMKGKGKHAPYLKLQFGAKVGEQLCLKGDETILFVGIGSNHSGQKIGFCVDLSNGQFPARKTKAGYWQFTMNEATIDGLFKSKFETIVLDEIEVQPRQGEPPMAMIDCPDSMLCDD